MKKLIIILLLFCCSLNASVEYRLAAPEDADQIMQLHTLFTEKDTSKLLLFPKHIQKEIIKNNIAKKRLFVAYEKATGEIISFLKLHIVDPNEIKNLLTQELNLGSESSIIQNICYNFSTKNIFDFSSEIPTLSQSKNTENIFTENLSHILHIYLGSSYTSPEFRSKGIYTELIYYAINSIKEHFANKKFLSLLYGQVEENAYSRVMVRVFASCISETFPSKKESEIKLRHIRSRAYKPEVDPDGKIKMFYDEKHQGYGNMVLYKTPVNS